MENFCCDPAAEMEYDSLTGTSDGSSVPPDDDDNNERQVLERDYDTQCPRLYKIIEAKDWDQTLHFLETGRFYDTNFFTRLFGDDPEPPLVQARTWVTALNDRGNVRWCQLPLHAAITFKAPYTIIARLIEVFPKSVRCADDQDMLPLHYAFRFGAEDDVLAHLLDEFPQALGKTAVKERLPLDMAQYGPNPERGIIVGYYVKNAIQNARSEWEEEYKIRMAVLRGKADAKLLADLELKINELRETEKQLEEAQQEIERLKEELACGSFLRSRSLLSLRAPSRDATATVETPDYAILDATVDAPEAARKSSSKQKEVATAEPSTSNDLTSRNKSRSFGQKMFGKRKKKGA